MPYMIYSAKRVVKDPDILSQVEEMIRTLKPTAKGFTIKDIYCVDEVVKSIVVILDADAHRPQFIHLWAKEIRPLIDAFNPSRHPEEHRIRLDQHCRVDNFNHDCYYERYR